MLRGQGQADAQSAPPNPHRGSLDLAGQLTDISSRQQHAAYLWLRAGMQVGAHVGLARMVQQHVCRAAATALSTALKDWPRQAGPAADISGVRKADMHLCKVAAAIMSTQVVV